MRRPHPCREGGVPTKPTARTWKAALATRHASDQPPGSGVHPHGNRHAELIPAQRAENCADRRRGSLKGPAGYPADPHLRRPTLPRGLSRWPLGTGGGPALAPWDDQAHRAVLKALADPRAGEARHWMAGTGSMPGPDPGPRPAVASPGEPVGGGNAGRTAAAVVSRGIRVGFLSVSWSGPLEADRNHAAELTAGRVC